MKSKVFLIAIPIGLILAGGALYFFLNNKKEETVSPAVPTSTTITQTTQTPKNLLWEDQAGFSFEYPEGLVINKHPEDKENYANIDFTDSAKTGNIKIIAADTKLKTIKDWAKQKEGTTGNSVDSTLGGKIAANITFSDSNKVIVGAIDQAILFTIELTPDSAGYFKKVYDQILTSFEFVYPTQAPVSGGNSSGSSGDIIEEEEILE